MVTAKNINTEINPAGNWESCKESLRKNIPEPIYGAFIAPLELKICRNGDDEQRLELEAPEEIREHLRDRHLPAIEKALREHQIFGQISLIGRATAPTAESLQSIEAAPQMKSEVTRRSSSNSSRPTPFLANPDSQRACEMVRSLRYGAPVAYLHGPSGCGKTTLGRDIEHTAREQGLDPLYLTLEEFLSEFSISCQVKSTVAWRTAVRSRHPVIIDDFQYLKKNGLYSQEELRNLIDYFRNQNCKLILLSDTPLEQLRKRFSNDLTSRLLDALQIELSAPVLENRLAILRNESERSQLPLSTRLATQLVRRLRSDGRALTAAIGRLRQLRELSPASFESASLTIEQIEPHISDLLAPVASIRPESILELIAAHYRLPVDAISGPARDRRYSGARQLVAWLSAQLTDSSYNEIARLIGRKDHSSVTYAIRSVDKKMADDLFYGKEVQQLLEQLKTIRNVSDSR